MHPGAQIHGRAFVVISVVVSFLLLSPPLCGAIPREVTLFPSSASVTDIARLPLQSAGDGVRKAVFHLPGAADPDSLVTHLPPDSPLRIIDQRWQKSALADDERAVVLRRQIQEAREARGSISAALQSIEVQIQFWQLQTKAKVKNAADAQNSASLIGKSIRRLAQEKIAQERELEKIDKRLADLKEELDRVSGRRETAWEVTVTLAGAPATETTLVTTYTLSGCGWRPLYRLDAHPAENMILFSWEAEIWQSTGRDWHQVALSLATLQPPASLSPPSLPAWIIRPVPAPGVLRRMDTAEAAPIAAAEATPDEPRQERKSTYTLWRIGKTTVPAGAKQIVKITETSWPAVFTRIARPSLGPQVFLQAAVSLPQSEEIPRGEALFLIDGALLGKRPFSLAGKDETIFFGVDPLVTAVIQLLEKKAGEKSFLAGRQTHVWAWRIDVRNGGRVPLTVRVEEPKPQVRDERIRLTVTADPPSESEDPSLLAWSVVPPAGGAAAISESIRIEAPKDFNLDLGWRK
jgi:uncharacterized protein (TIGR02231 family)